MLRKHLSNDEVGRVLEYGNPPKGGSVIAEAYSKHVSGDRCKKLDENILKEAVDRVAERRGEIIIDGPVDEDFTAERLASRVRRALMEVSGDKSPGYPLNLMYANKEQALACESEEIVKCAVARLLLFSEGLDALKECLKMKGGLVFAGYIDPSTVFVKAEPHPRRKLKLKKYRCINPISLVDEAVERVLFKESGRVLKEPENIFTNGSGVGIGFTDRQNREFMAVVNDLTQRFGPPVALDVTRFDGVHSEETLMATVEIDIATHKSLRGKLTKWGHCNRVWAKCSAHSAVVIGNKLIIKLRPGMLNTGSQDTSRRNTLLENLYTDTHAIIAGEVVYVICNGDDALVWGIKDLQAFLDAAKETGIGLRDVIRCSDGQVSFCSHKYLNSDGAAELTSWPKAIYRICSMNVEFADAMQAVNEMRHNQEHGRLLDFVKEVYGRDN